MGIIYCRKDTYLLIRILQIFLLIIQNDPEFAGIKITINTLITAPAFAISLFNKKYYLLREYPMMLQRVNSRIVQDLRDAYHGGRTEVFSLFHNVLELRSSRHVYHYDVPGMYNKVMGINLPFGDPIYVSKATFPLKDFVVFLETLDSINMGGFFKVYIETPPASVLPVPILPFKNPDTAGGKLVFPTGN